MNGGYLGAPCKNCKKRHSLCYNDCPEYQAFRKARDAENDKRHKEYELRAECSGLMFSKRCRSEQKRWRNK